MLSRMIVDEIRRRYRASGVAQIVFDVLAREGIDTTTTPTADEMKPLLVAAYRALRSAEEEA